MVSVCSNIETNSFNVCFLNTQFSVLQGFLGKETQDGSVIV